MSRGRRNRHSGNHHQLRTLRKIEREWMLEAKRTLETDNPTKGNSSLGFTIEPGREYSID